MSKELEAKSLYSTLCQTLDNMKWTYNKEEEKDSLVIRTSAVGNDLSMKLIMRVDIERQVMYLKSPMPFTVPEDKRFEMMKSIIIANYSMLNGSFEMDPSDGWTAFKLIVPFMGSIISEEVCKYMIVLSCNMIDKFNDKFQAVAEGRMTAADIQKLVNQK